MFWAVLLLAMLVGGCIAAVATRRLRTHRPQWSGALRIIGGSLVVPGALVFLAVVGTIWAYAALPSAGEAGAEMTAFIVLVIAVVFGVTSFVGGLIGAAIAEKRQ